MNACPGIAIDEPPASRDRREALVAGADLGVSGPKPYSHVDDPDPGAPGRGDRGSQPGQVAPIVAEALHDALSHIHDEQGG
jgi:hypothetical protein